jgi:hypothetical protein
MVATGTITVSPTEKESRIALMVRLIRTLLEYLLMWLLQLIQLRLKNAAGCISAPTSVTINTQPATPAATALQLCNQRAVATER